MTKIAKIKRLDNADEFIKILHNKELLIYEDVQGSKIFVNWNGKRISIKPKTLRAENLNFIDLTVQKYYNQAHIFFNSLPNYITTLINKNWWFCFEYFPDNQPANIEYNKLPLNNLILTCIVKNDKYVYDFNELMEYSRLFNVEPLPIIFRGKLSDKQLEVIQLYLNTSENDLKYIFDENNFAYFFYKILNPNIENSFLMNNKEFNNNLEKMVIKIDGKSDYSFEILNPLYNKMVLINNTEHVDTYSLILIKFLEFCQLINLEDIKLYKIFKDKLYVEFISEIFNRFIRDNEKNIDKWNFTVPTFFKEDKFKINIDLLSNQETIDYVNSSEKIEYVFKCILGSFNSERKKPIGIFNEKTLEIFNKFVNKLSIIIDKNLKINRETELNKDTLKDFKSYFDLKYEVDAGEDIYPDVFDEFGEDESSDKKKDKGGKKDLKGKGKDIEEIQGLDDFEPKKEVIK